MIAAIRGPYCTGPSAPAGPAPLVRCPQMHSRSISWCPVTSTAAGGRPGTWRRSTPVTGRPARPAPPPAQQAGSCGTSRSGFATCANVRPSCPSCPRRACGRSSSAATAAPASPAPPPTAAPGNYAASDSAGPPAQRSAPAPAPAPRWPALTRPGNQPAHRAARPPGQPAPHRQNQHDHRAHPDTTAKDHLAHASRQNRRAGIGSAPLSCAAAHWDTREHER
jgi:hypothetical protein